MIEKLTIRINPEDSVGAGIVEFYNRVAAAMGLDPAPLFYDCTKINVSKNIQDNIFETLDRQSSDPCYTGMMWVARGPKADTSLPNDTVELLAGFFCNGREEKPLPFNATINIEQEAA